ncbi:PilN domain-containing protein [Metabacillus bambusae]|uniref:PilN domain-containing protein n=1 Tax=Metabacillus bambusae TaxID=2795218 RepID=A0ABS3N906_9BACI|nr:PilN domain-containing protein [Metabacillus bambusae]MBO1514761.1 PilN domain-containing protein [Metabacillus bambusae]
MLAEINLLPRKDLKNQAKRLVFLVILIITIIVISLFFLQARSLSKAEEVAENNRIKLQEQLEKKLQEDNQVSGKSTSAEKLQTAVNFAEFASKDMIPVLEELTQQLPERGYVLIFEQIDLGTINLVVQFDMNRDAAYYLTRLKESATFEQILLQKIETKNEESEGNNNLSDSESEIEIPRVEATYQIKIKNSVDGAKNGGENNEDSAS